MARSQNGWPVVTGALTSLPQVTGKVLTGPVWVVFYWLCCQFAAHVEPITKTWSWGWSHRKIAGSKKWSNHASGTAVDLNAPRHGAGKLGTFTPAQVAQIGLILKASQGVIRWGHLFKDEMHFEIAPGVTADQVKRFAVYLFQVHLSGAGFNPGDLDGLLGPRTNGAAMAFCGARGIAGAGLPFYSPVIWPALMSAQKVSTPK